MGCEQCHASPLPCEKTKHDQTDCILSTYVATSRFSVGRGDGPGHSLLHGVATWLETGV